MKSIPLILLFIIVSCGKGQINHHKIKSITKTINDTILEKQEFDINGKLVFEYHNQIDFGHENSIIFITAFEFDSINNKTIKYHANSRSSLDLTIDSIGENSLLRNKKIGIFDEIINKESYRQSLFNSSSKERFVEFFKSNYPSDLPFKYNTNFSDTINTNIVKVVRNDTLIIETTKEQNGFNKEYSKVYLNDKNKKVKEIVQGKYNSLIENIYDEKGRLILQNETGQHYKFYYENNLLTKKEMYHGDALAFKDEYFYENDILIKEVKHRITESKYFLKKPKLQTVHYNYEYY